MIADARLEWTSIGETLVWCARGDLNPHTLASTGT